MSRSRFALAAVAAGATILSIAATAVAKPATTRVAVVAGKPSEFSFKLTRHVVARGTVVFTIKNGGAITHDFKVCSRPRHNTAPNTCNGKGSRKLTKGQSTTLRVTFRQRGTYEYLCTVPGHAAAGMKGLLTVR